MKLKETIEGMYAFAYKDDGPARPCGQSCSITCSWDKLYLFNSYEKMRELGEQLTQSKSRRNPRITASFYPDDTVHSINFVEGEV